MFVLNVFLSGMSNKPEYPIFDTLDTMKEWDESGTIKNN